MRNIIIRAGCYARFSDDQQKQGKSIEAQIGMAREFAAKQGWVFRDDMVFADEGISGGEEERPGLLDMLNAAERHEFEVLLCEDTSRLARDPKIYYVVKGNLAKSGVKITFIAKQFSDDEYGELLETIVVGVDKLNRRLQAAKTRRHLREVASRGYVYGGKAPFGLRLKKIPIGGKKPNGDKRTATVYEHNPQNIDHAKFIIDRWLAGVSAYHISRELMQRGVQMTDGAVRTWIYTTAEIFAGKIIWGRTPPHQGGGNKYQPREAWEFFDGQHKDQSIISMEQARKAVERILYRPRGRRNSHRGNFVLTSLLHCGDCGGRLASHGLASTPNGSYYRCHNARKHFNCSNNRYFPKKKIEQIVCDRVAESIFQRATVQDWTARLKKFAKSQLTSSTNVRETMNQVEKIKSEAGSRLKNLVTAISKGVIDYELAKNAIQSENEVIASANKQLEQLKPFDEFEGQSLDWVDFEPVFADWRKILTESNNADAVRRLLSLSIKRVTINHAGDGNIEADMEGITREISPKFCIPTSAGLRWRPQRDSNPCCRDENPVS